MLIGEVATRLAEDSPCTRNCPICSSCLGKLAIVECITKSRHSRFVSIFESLVRILFDHFDLESKTLADMSLPNFTAAKEKLLTHLESWPDEDLSKGRLIGLIRSANPLSMREKVQAVCKQLGLNREVDMDKVFTAWKAARNPLAHGKFGGDDDQAFIDTMHAKSRIAGGFNTLLLKLFGYAGYYNASVFEPGFQRMNQSTPEASKEAQGAGNTQNDTSGEL